MATKPLSAADVEKLKGFLKSGSVTPYSPEFASKLAGMIKDPPKSKGLAAKPLLKTPTPQSTGLLQSPDTEFTTDNVNPYMNPFTQDAMGPTVQETVAAAKPGVPALPSAVPTVANDPNIAVSQTAPQPKTTKEVTTTKKANGDTVEKAKHVEEPVNKPAPKANPGNGELLLGDNLRAGAAPVDDGKPKTYHDMPAADVNGAPMGPSEAGVEPKMLPDDNPYELPGVYRFNPTAPPAPIVAQYPAQMPAIPEGRLTNTEGLIPAENTATQGLTTNISALAPLPKEEEERFAALRDQRLGQISDNEAAARDFITSYSPRTDMSALLSFIGSQLGRDYLKGYQKPAGLGDLVGMQDKLEENIAKAKTGLSDTDMQYLKARMGLQDSQKMMETLQNTYNNSQGLAKLKASGDLTTAQATNQANKMGAALEARFKEYDDASTQNPGVGAKLEAYKTILESSVDIDKILARNGGAFPNPKSVDYDIINQKIAQQLVLMNKFRFLLGALQGADERIVRTGMGVDENTMPNWVRSLSSDKREGIAQAQSSFQQSLIDEVNTMDSKIINKYERGAEFMKTPDLITYHKGKVSEVNAVIKELLMNKPGPLTPKQQESLFKVITPEQRESIRRDVKKRSDAVKKSGGK